MNHYALLKPLKLAILFIKEQLKEPIALFWIVISPVVTYYLITYARGGLNVPASDYLSSTSWFFSFIASSVAFFGLAFYIVGRRESGFIRSFIYLKGTKAVFLAGQFLAYSFVSLVYCAVFYVFTRAHFGVLDVAELLVIMGRFYVCFLIFSTPALLLTLMPMGFQSTNTIFSVLSLAMLSLGVISAGSLGADLNGFRLFNPMWWANHVMLVGVADALSVVCTVVTLLGFSLWGVYRFLIINPVWSRY